MNGSVTAIKIVMLGKHGSDVERTQPSTNQMVFVNGLDGETNAILTQD